MEGLFGRFTRFGFHCETWFYAVHNGSTVSGVLERVRLFDNFAVGRVVIHAVCDILCLWTECAGKWAFHRVTFDEEVFEPSDARCKAMSAPPHRAAARPNPSRNDVGPSDSSPPAVSSPRLPHRSLARAFQKTLIWRLVLPL